MSPALLVYGRELRPAATGMRMARQVKAPLIEHAHEQMRKMQAAWIAARKVSEETTNPAAAAGDNN